MKKNILLVLVLFSFVGCSNTPEEAVKDVFEAIKEGDLVKLSSNSSIKTSGYFSMNALKKCTEDRSKYKDNEMELVDICLKRVYSHTRLESLKIVQISKNEANAHVDIFSDQKTISHIWKVLKVNGQWKLFVEGKKTNPESHEESSHDSLSY